MDQHGRAGGGATTRGFDSRTALAGVVTSGLLYCTVVLDLVSSVSHYIETPPLRSKAHTPAQLDSSTDSTVLTVKSKVHWDLAGVVSRLYSTGSDQDVMSLDLIWMSSDHDHHGSVTATPRCRHVLSHQMQKKIFLSRTGIEPATTKIRIHNGIRTCDHQLSSDPRRESNPHQIRSSWIEPETSDPSQIQSNLHG